MQVGLSASEIFNQKLGQGEVVLHLFLSAAQFKTILVKIKVRYLKLLIHSESLNQIKESFGIYLV